MLLSDAAGEQEEEVLQRQLEREAKTVHWRHALSQRKPKRKPKDNIRELFPAHTVRTHS